MRILSLPLPANVKRLKPYASARSLLKGDDWIFLDANESPVAPSLSDTRFAALNRYPDPTGDALRDAIAISYGVDRENLILGNGSDELIDLVVRSFVRKGRRILSISPTYGMYRVSAQTNGAGFDAVPLAPNGGIAVRSLLSRTGSVDLLFLCSPNNPTGTAIDPVTIRKIVDGFPGLVVVDEAYGEFADAAGIPSAIALVRGGKKNVIVLRTFSKAFAAAGIRLGYGIASPEIIKTLLAMKPPYNVNRITQHIGACLWKDAGRMRRRVRTLTAERERLMKALSRLGCRAYPSVTNFFLFDLPNGRQAAEVYANLRERNGIVLRLIAWDNRQLLRVTVGSRRENDLFLSAIASLL